MPGEQEQMKHASVPHEGPWGASPSAASSDSVLPTREAPLALGGPALWKYLSPTRGDIIKNLSHLPPQSPRNCQSVPKQRSGKCPTQIQYCP